jgi:AraC-like DNA-binding protein
MTTVFASSDVPAPARTEYWRHVLSDALVPLEPFGPPDAPGLRLLLGHAGPVAVGELSHDSEGGARRTTRHIRRSDPELCKIDVLARGSGVIEQGGREAELRPGDLTLVDLSRPATWAMSDVRCVAVVFPRSMLPLRDRELARLVAVPIRGDRGAGALISSLARQLPRHLDGCGESGGARLGGAVLDLFMAALAGTVDRTSDLPAETRRRALIQRIHASIEERLGDPELSPGNIAAAHFISVRFLHRLFETQQTTVGEWIRRRRLERCARDLLDPALAGEPIIAIGSRWGITNPAHFSRLFRARFGVSPSEYRAACGRPDQPRP